MEILGLPEEENEALLAELFSYLYDPEFILEHDWHTHDLVVWDNNAVQHARKTVDLEGPTRTLRKVTGPLTFALGEIPLPYFSKVAEKA
jgi:taurine dioxygenase